MRRLVVLFLALVSLLGLAGCDRTDREWGDDGVVRVGVTPEDLVPVVGTDDAPDLFVVGHEQNHPELVIAQVAPDGVTRRTVRLPASFATRRSTGAIVGEDDGAPVLNVIAVDAASGEPDELKIAQVAHGALVSTFGAGGIASTGVELDSEPQHAAVSRLDGSMTVIGTHQGRVLLVRVTRDGTLDPGFGDEGVVTLPASIYGVGSAVQLAGGRVLMVGTSVETTTRDGIPLETDFAVLRVTARGALDPTFGTGGVAKVSFNDSDAGQDIEVRPDGRIVVAGITFTDDLKPSEALAGLTASGAPDPGFGLYARSMVNPLPPDHGLDRVWLAQGGPGFVTMTEENGVIYTVGFKQSGVVEESWGEKGIQRTALGPNTQGADLEHVYITCDRTTCDGKARFIVAAQTWASPGGALVGFTP